MAKKIEDMYPGRSVPSSTDYPAGSFKDESTPGMNDGTPLQVDWKNDREGMNQGIMKRAGVEYGGDIDTANGQYIKALESMTTPSPFPANATLNDLCGELVDIQWEAPWITPNYVSTGETIRGACLSVDQNTKKAVIYVLHDDATISPLSGVWEYTTPALGTALTLPYGGTVDTACAICSDGDYLYVAWYETAGNLKISKFSQGVSSWSLEWTRTTLATSSLGWDDGVKLCIANSNNIGVLFTASSVAPYQLSVGVLAKDNSSFTIGTPSPNRYQFFQNSKIISDGTYLYSIGHTGTDPYSFDICQFQITNPTIYTIMSIATSISSSNWNQYPTGLAYAHGTPVITCPDGTLYVANFPTSVETVGTLDGTSYGSQDWGTILDSDGIHLWALQPQVDYTGSVGIYRLFRINQSDISWFIRPATPYFPSMFINSPGISIVEPEKTPGKMIFDGIAMWLITYNGNIYRVCAPGSR